MAVARLFQNHLDRLPDELLLDVIEQRVLHVRDLISLARTSRRYHRVVISPAYRFHVERESGLAIYWAIENNERGTLERLAASGVDVNMLYKDNLPLNPSILYILHNYEDTKASVEHTRLARFSPLAWAASHGQDSMVGYLLDHGAYIDTKSTRLCGCPRELLRCQTYLPDPPRIFGVRNDDDDDDDDDDRVRAWWTPLHYAICNRHESTARLLLERGANARDIGGKMTALHAATLWAMDDIIDYLINHGLVDINTQAYKGTTVLHLAHLWGSYDLVNRYLDCGADINLAYSQETGPWSILAMACAEASFGQALQYLRRGASPHFVVFDDALDDPWTVMRLIYGHRYNGFLFSSEDLQERMDLEREIIEGGRVGPSHV